VRFMACKAVRSGLAKKRFESDCTRKRMSWKAIRGVSLDFHSGEAVGVIGSNGSGKSTLLRTIAGLQRRTAGSVHVASQPQFLGVSAALNNRVSGFRNVILGGLALGFDRAEIADRMAEVINFSGLSHDEMERPFYSYSSGMRARLALAIALLRTPRILLLDEALAVGDRQFRERSLDRVNTMRQEAGTVLMVSHNLSEIAQTCHRTVWLERGAVRKDGPSAQVLQEYAEWSDRPESAVADRTGGRSPA
jgi:teichoic acid transport system ATP-binding protein